MKQYLAQIALLVKEYDEAIFFYTKKLGFVLLEDISLSESKRWVVVSPPGEGQCRLLLARAVGERQLAAVGNQSGGRVFLFLYTDDIGRDLEQLKDNDIPVVRGPANEPYGRVAVFADLYGNLWDLIQPA